MGGDRSNLGTRGVSEGGVLGVSNLCDIVKNVWNEWIFSGI